MRSIKSILIQRDGLTPEEADDLIAEATEALHQYIEAGDFASYDVCEEFFGLEPDYLEQLI